MKVKIFAVVCLMLALPHLTVAQTSVQINSTIASIGNFLYLTLDNGDRVRATPLTISTPPDSRSFAKTLTVFCVGNRLSWVCKRAQVGQALHARGEIVPSLLFVNTSTGPITDFRFDPIAILLSDVELQ